MRKNVLVEQLPSEVKAWVKSLRSSSAREVIDTILRDIGPENFSKYWKKFSNFIPDTFEQDGEE